MLMKYKAVIAGSVALFALGLATPAAAAFVGPYQLSNFVLAAPGGGSVNVSGAPDTFTLTGSDTGSGDDVVTAFSVAAQASGLVSFSFSYLTNDFFGGIHNSAQDPAGYVLNGVFTQLSIDDFSIDPGPLQQSGSASFAVNAGDVFGFYVESLDSKFGEANLAISNFSGPIAAVPEPGDLALFGLGLAGIAALRRRRIAG
jgi:hypothetical protein